MHYAITLATRPGRITNEDVWAILGVDVGRRTPDLQRRLGAAMKAIGWKPNTIKLDTGRQARRVRGYGRGTNARRLYTVKDKNDPPFVTYGEEDQDGL